MSTVDKIIILLACVIVAGICYACCLVAAAADEAAERMYREQIEQKRIRKEKGEEP